MLARLLTGTVIRIVPIGMVLLAIQKTLFIEVQPFGVVIQLVMAFAAAAGAAGGSERGALAGFTLGIVFDLAVGSPLGSSSIAMAVAGYTAGLVKLIRVETWWWLAAIFTGLGTGVGELMVPVVRRFVGEQDAFAPDLYVVIAVVAVAGAIASIVLVPLARWALRIERSEWKAPAED